jgi:TIR domain
MAKIFVCYRRDDSSAEAARITDWLDRHFGEDEVFMDITAIGLGDDFVAKIEDEIDSIDALIAVIGRRWLETDAEGKSRIEDPEDYVRIEIARALGRDIRVIPVLVQGAEMPPKSELPEDIQSLTRRNALRMTLEQFKAEIGQLIKALEGIVTTEKEREPDPLPPTPSPTKAVPQALSDGAWLAGLVASAVLLLGIGFNSGARTPERFIHPSFGGTNNFVGGSDFLWRLAGLWVSLPTIGIVAVALWGLFLARRPGSDVGFGAGLVLAAGLQGTVFYAAWMTGDGDVSAFFLPLVGALGLTAIGIWLVVGLLRPDLTRHRHFSVPLSAVAAGGAAAMILGMFVDFRGTRSLPAADVIHGPYFQKWDLLLISITALAIVLMAVPGPGTLSIGVLTACGIGGATLWVRFVMIPLTQKSWVTSVGAGGVIGLAGAVAIIVAASSARRALRAKEPVPLLTPSLR